MPNGLFHRIPSRVAVFAAAAFVAGGVTCAATPASAAAAQNGFAVAGESPVLAEANGHVFDWPNVSGDDTIHVYDLTGKQVATIPDEAGVQSFDVSADGGRLYVGLGDPDALSVIDTATLTESARYDLSDLGVANHVDLVGNRLYIAAYGNNSTAVGVIGADQTSGSPTLVAGGSGDVGGAGVVVFPSSTAGTDEIVISSCSFGGTCSVSRYSYDGVHATQEVVANANDYGKVLWDEADGVVLTQSTNGIAIRDPQTLDVRWTVAGHLGSAPSRLLSGKLVTFAEDPTTGHIVLEVRDLTGATTFRATPTAPDTRLVPILQSEGSTVYATANRPGAPLRVVALPYALKRPTTPEAPTAVTARLLPAGHIVVTWQPSAIDGNDAPTRYEIRRTTSNGFGAPIAVLTPTATSYEDASTAHGAQYLYEVAAINALGEANGATTDRITPDFSAPAVHVATPSPFTVTPTATVSYSATDSGSKVASYDVRSRSAASNGGFGAYAYPASWQGRTVTQVTVNLAAGRDYCVSVRARDHAGNLSAWSADRCTAAPIDDRALHRATTGWTNATGTSAYRGTTSVATTRDAQLTSSVVHVDRVALVATTCSTCGSVAVYLGSRYWRTVSLHSTATHTRVTLALPKFSLRRTTISLRTTSAKKVVVDGLGISRT